MPESQTPATAGCGPQPERCGEMADGCGELDRFLAGCAQSHDADPDAWHAVMLQAPGKPRSDRCAFCGVLWETVLHHPRPRAPRITDEEIRAVAAETGESEEIVRSVAEAIECCEDEQDL